MSFAACKVNTLNAKEDAFWMMITYRIVKNVLRTCGMWNLLSRETDAVAVQYSIQFLFIFDTRTIFVQGMEEEEPWHSNKIQIHVQKILFIHINETSLISK